MKKLAYFPGRFQPFHNGHLETVKKLADEYEKVVILIRGTKKSDKNPFGISLRQSMIVETLRDEGLDNVAVLVERLDMNADLVTGNPQMRDYYTQTGMKVVWDESRATSATEIRKKKEEGDDSWEELVPKAVAEEIKSYEGRSL